MKSHPAPMTPPTATIVAVSKAKSNHEPPTEKARARAEEALKAESERIRMQAEQRVQRINLHLALGGSFEATPPPTKTSDASSLRR